VLVLLAAALGCEAFRSDAENYIDVPGTESDRLLTKVTDEVREGAPDP
jgi:hypothetical protein